jgi:hypothetical protein
MRRALWLCLPAFLACAVGRRSPAIDRPTGAAALEVALRDTATATRVYLPTEVAQEAADATTLTASAGTLESNALRVHATVAEPSEAYGAIRGIIDTSGFVERATLTVVPGSDPLLASALLAEAERFRWRPARLADGRPVRQLFEWNRCRNCAHLPLPEVRRAMESR